MLVLSINFFQDKIFGNSFNWDRGSTGELFKELSNSRANNSSCSGPIRPIIKLIQDIKVKYLPTLKQELQIVAM